MPYLLDDQPLRVAAIFGYTDFQAVFLSSGDA